MNFVIENKKDPNISHLSSLKSFLKISTILSNQMKHPFVPYNDYTAQFYALPKVYKSNNKKKTKHPYLFQYK